MLLLFGCCRRLAPAAEQVQEGAVAVPGTAVMLYLAASSAVRAAAEAAEAEACLLRLLPPVQYSITSITSSMRKLSAL